MGHAYTAIVFPDDAFDARAVLDALAAAEDVFPEPHPHPREELWRVTVADGVTALFYGIGGYSPARCHGFEHEFMVVDGFLDMVAEHAGRRTGGFRFCGFLSEDTGDTSLAQLHTDRRFEMRQILDDRTAQRVWSDDDGDLHDVTADVGVDPTPFERDGELADEAGYFRRRDEVEAPFSPAGLLQHEVGVGPGQVLAAYVRRTDLGTLLWSYPRARARARPAGRGRAVRAGRR